MATTYQSIHTGQFIDEQISAVSEKLPLTGGVVSGTIQATKFIGNLEGAATKLLTARTINLIGDVSGSGSFNGANDLNIEVTVQNNSHEHSWVNIADRDSCTINTSGTVTGSKVYGAVWNDYAEYRA